MTLTDAADVTAAKPAPMPIIVGVPRSGTTLLRMMLDAHPELAIPPETWFLPALAALDDTDRASPSDALRILTGSETWADFHIAPDEIAAHLQALDPFSPAAAARCFYRVYAARFQKARWGDKTPGYLTRMDVVDRLLPEACFIHVIRDGRDVAVSLRPMWFATSRSIGALAAQWREEIGEGRRLGARVGRYVELRYEDLVRDPERTVRELCGHLDLPPDDLMLRFYERASARLDEHEARTGRWGRVVLTKEQRRQQQIMTTRPPEPSRIGRWRAELKREEQSEFEGVAGDLLAELGYL